jgi:hypothetical protein
MAGDKMTRPPRLAALLLALAPRAYRQCLAGDLEEQFIVERRSRLWYWRQVVRSIPALISMRARKDQWERAAASLLLLAGWMLVAWHTLWTFVLSQVPLKADPAGWFTFHG